MISLRNSSRLQLVYLKYLRNISLCNYGWKNQSFIHTIGKHTVTPKTLHNSLSVRNGNLYSTSSVSSNSEELVDGNIFEKICEETLESLTEFFEELIERKDIFKNADVSYSSGVLTINLGNKYGTYVINRQSPNRQIWLSSPISGPKRYDYLVSGKYWIYKHDMVPLHKLLESEISSILGEHIDFSSCLYAKT